MPSVDGSFSAASITLRWKGRSKTSPRSMGFVLLMTPALAFSLIVSIMAGASGGRLKPWRCASSARDTPWPPDWLMATTLSPFIAGG